MKKFILSTALLLAVAPLLLANHPPARPAHQPKGHRPAHVNKPVHKPTSRLPHHVHKPVHKPSYKPTHLVKPTHKPSYKPAHKPGYRGKIVTAASYVKLYGKKFSGGYYYKGHNHRHWKRTYYSAKWKTMMYYCPSTKVWYYWYAPTAVYYPIRYITVAAPTAEAAPAEQEAQEEAVTTDDQTAEEDIPNPEEPELAVGASNPSSANLLPPQGEESM
jgi:hypothetical protein